MPFIVETTKTKQIHANSEPKPWFLMKLHHDDSEPKTMVILKTEPNKTTPRTVVDDSTASRV